MKWKNISFFKKDKWCGKLEQNLLWLMFGMTSGILIVLVMLSFDDKVINIIKALGSLMIVLSIGIAINQFRLNRKQFEENKKWNRKDAAIKALHSSQHSISDTIRLLDEHIKITKHFETYKTYDIADLHNSFGVFVSNNMFVFHSEETQSDIKNCATRGSNSYITTFKSINGRELYSAIESYLNEVEYLATACEMEIFDKETIYNLKGGGFISGFIVFKNFIYHNRYDERHGYGPTLYENFEKLAYEFAKRRDIKIEEPTKKDYLTPFDSRNY